MERKGNQRKHRVLSVLLCSAMAVAGLMPGTAGVVQAVQGREGAGLQAAQSESRVGVQGFQRENGAGLQAGGSADAQAREAQGVITPGSQWLDNQGTMIQAHGGGVLWDAKTQKYYWYGEHKGESNIKNGCVIAIGVSCYSSTDLCSWKNEGVALPVFNHPAFLAGEAPAEDTPLYLAESSPEYQAAKAAGKAVSPYDTLEKYNTASYIGRLNSLYAGRTAAEKRALYQKFNWDSVLERPKVLYNQKNDNYVMWFHKDGEGAGNYSLAQTGIAVSDSPAGPFRLVDAINPLGKESRDMTLFQDDDGKAYLIYSSEDNWTLYIAELNEDYTGLTGIYSRNYVDKGGSKGQYAREAPAIFKYQGSYYLISSGCTGWRPNVMGYSVASNLREGMSETGGNGPFQMNNLKNPCIGLEADISFNGQSTFVLPVQGKEGAFIYMGDRWNQNNLKDSRYQWLPIQIDAEEKALTLAWNDSWRIEDFDKVNSQARVELNRAIRAGDGMASAEYDFGQERWQVFQQAMQTAKNLAFGTEISQVTALKDQIVQSMEALRRWKPLDAAFAEVENRAEAAYTVSSWKDVKKAYEAGKALGDAATDAQIGDAAAAIQAAVGKLEEVKMKTEEIDLKGKAIRADSQQSGNEAEKAIDGNSGTIWHCKWGNGATPLPHSLTIDLGQPYEDLYQLYYLPRQDKDSNGIASRYRILASNADKDISQLADADFTEVRTGIWAEDKTEKSTIFRTNGVARYLRFEIIAGIGDFASAAEIRLLCGTPEGGEMPPAEIKVSKITLTGAKTELLKGEELTLKAEIAPEDAANKAISWESSDEGVAKVSSQGIVTAVSAGTATITAVSADGSGVKGTYSITVKEEPQVPTEIKVSAITIRGDKAKLLKGGKLRLQPTIAPENATNKAISWSSSNRSVARVDSQGTVTAVSAGTAVITATATDGSGVKGTYQVTVTVHLVKKITLESEYKAVAAGKKVKVTAAVATTGKTASKALAWTVSNKKYATVNAKGIVSTKKAGAGKTITVTAKAKDASKKKASIKIKIVKDAVKKITLSCQKKTLPAGRKVTVKASVKAGKTANKALAWSTSNKKYATVNSKGVVTAKKAGKGKTVTIKAVSTDGTNRKAVIKLKIK